MTDYTYDKSSYDRGGSQYGAKDSRGIVSGQAYKTNTEKHLDVPKTRTSNSAGHSGLEAGMAKNRVRNPNRPVQQNAYRTTGTPSLGKASGWQTKGDQRKHVMGRAYSMNQVSMARIMKGNVNANEGAYMKRGGNGQV